MSRVYPHNFEQKIGFDRMRGMIANLCSGSIAKEHSTNFAFSKSHAFISSQIDETVEFMKILRGDINLPLEYVIDIRESLKRAKIEGAYLDSEDLFNIKRSLETSRSIVHFFKNQDDENRFLSLRRVIADLNPLPYVYDRVSSIVTKHGKIKDNASPELSSIRREIYTKQSGVSKTMHSILRRLQSEGLVDKDSGISIRDGRPVIPVPSAVKRRVKGIVQDESATGKTSFIEPTEIVEVNNQIRELEYAERRELIKILTLFTEDIRPYLYDIENIAIILGQLDFIRAKAKLSIQFDSIKPKIEREAGIEYIDARHPLLEINLKQEKRAIVPLDITLNREGRILLISGPNAGGKSVCLKTTALLQYMFQSGMPIPVHSSSRVGIFDNLFIDIGDEQSLDNDLSTYSSHLLNMKYFVRNCNSKTLILIDEFGTGTEPMLGGAIAESVLKEINSLGSYGVITTHYTNLKHFASSAEGIENGAMLYNSNLMEPLFKLSIGKPGSSFAFEIARKIGLPEHILAEATGKVGADHINFDKHLREITRDKRYWEEKRRKVRRMEKQLEEMSESYKQDLESTNKVRKEIISKAKEEAEQIVSNSNKIVERTIREIKESQADKQKTRDIRDKLTKFKSEFIDSDDETQSKISKKMLKLKERESNRKNRLKKGERERAAIAPRDDEYGSENSTGGEDINKSSEKQLKSPIKALDRSIKTLAVGDIVRVKDSVNKSGEVIEIKGNNITVALGNLSSIIKLNRLEITTKSREKKRVQTAANSSMAKLNQKISDKRLNFKADIDLRGVRADEALTRISLFLDEAIMVDARELRISHGKGSGVLRDLIRKFLQSEPMVSSFKDEHIESGGSGVTLVYM